MDDDPLDEKIWGPMPSEEEIRQAGYNNGRRLIRLGHARRLLGSGMSNEGKDLWLATPNPFLAGQRPGDILNDLDQSPGDVYAAIESYMNGDFA